MRSRTTKRSRMTTTICQGWDLIEAWGVHDDLKVIVLHYPDDDNKNKEKEDKDEEEDKDKEENNNEEEDNNNNFLALRLDGDLRFSRGPQIHTLPSAKLIQNKPN